MAALGKRISEPPRVGPRPADVRRQHGSGDEDAREHRGAEHIRVTGGDGIPGELLADQGAARIGEAPAERLVAEEADGFCCNIGWIVHVCKKTCLAVRNDIENPFDRRADHGETRGKGLNERVPHALGSRRPNKNVGRGKIAGHVAVRHVAEKSNRRYHAERPGELLDAGPLWSAAKDMTTNVWERLSYLGKGADKNVHAVLWHKPRYGDYRRRRCFLWRGPRGKKRLEM